MKSKSFFTCSQVALSFMGMATWATLAWCAEPNWVLLDQNIDSRFYYDQNVSQKSKEGFIPTRTRIVYTELGKADALKILGIDKKFEKLFESRYLHDLDCKKKSNRLLEATHLDEEGVTLKSTDLKSVTEWEEILPDTRFALVLEKACSR